MNKAGKQNSRGFLECAICQLIVFFTEKGNLFSLMARIRIATVLHGYQYNYTDTVPIGKASRHLFFSIHAFVRERLQLLRWFFTWTTHLFSRKKNCLYCVRNHK